MKFLKVLGLVTVAGVALSGCEETVLSNINIAGELEVIGDDFDDDWLLGSYQQNMLSEGLEVRLSVVGSECPGYEDGNVAASDLIAATGSSSYLMLDDTRHEIKSTICGNQSIERYAEFGAEVARNVNGTIVESFGIWATTDEVSDDRFSYQGLTLLTNGEFDSNDDDVGIDTSLDDAGDTIQPDLSQSQVIESQNALAGTSYVIVEEENETGLLIGLVKITEDSPNSLAGKTVFAVCDIEGSILGEGACPQYIGVLNSQTPLERMQLVLDDARADGSLSNWRYRTLSRLVSSASRYDSRGYSRLASLKLRTLIWSATRYRSGVSPSVQAELRSLVADYNAG